MVPEPAPTRGVAPPRWGVFDAGVAWVVSLMAGAIALAPFVEGEDIPARHEDVATFVGVTAQTAAALLLLLYVARARGLGSLAADFGLRIRARDWPFGLAGLVLGFVALGLLVPITELGDIEETSQDVKRIFDEATGLGLGVLIVSVLVLAPIGEELIFRGVLLRSLQRRLPAAHAISASALAFALAHFLLDPGSGFGLPVLALLGVVSGWRAVASGDLSQSIWLHAGFNLLAVLGRAFDA